MPLPITAVPSPAANPTPTLSRDPQVSKLPTHPTLPPRPSFPQFEDERRSPIDLTIPSHTSDPQRPRKIRRLSGDAVAAARASNSTGSAVKVSYGHDGSASRGDWSRGHGSGTKVRGKKRKGLEWTPKEKDKETGKDKKSDTSTPANSDSNAKRLGDYSAYKGRGRYAQDALYVYLFLPVLV